MARILFITGTDTGVGKTVVTCLLVHHLRAAGQDAVALKPVCSGGREDVRCLRRAQDNVLREEEICPFHFRQPVTPMVAAKAERRRLTLARAVRSVRQVDHDWVLVEGAGGLLSPLGPRWSAADWINALGAEVIVVAADRVGTLNHTLLTMEALRRRGCERVRVVLSAVSEGGDASVRSNMEVLAKELGERMVGRVPWLGSNPFGDKGVARHKKNLKKTLARLARSYSFASVL